jgi:hypothetical protein
MWKWIKQTKNSSDQKYSALMEFLIEDRGEQEEKSKCYRLPVGAIAKEFKVAGDEVGDLLRSRSEPCLVPPDDPGRTPWIDFLAAGVGTSAHPVNWLAFVTSDARSALDATKPHGNDSVLETKTSDPERIKILHKILKELSVLFVNGTNLPPEKARKDQPIDLSEIRDRFMNRSADRNSESHGCASVPEILVFFMSADETAAKTIFAANCEMNLHHVVSLDDLKSILLGNWQSVFGPGWLGTLDRFHKAMKRSASNKKTIIEIEADKLSGLQEALAAIATTKLITYGWLPSHLNESSAMLGKPSLGTARKYILKQLHDEGIRFFPLPCVNLPQGEQLNIRNQQELSEAMWLNFKSPHPVDKVILAIEITAYGRRNKSAGSSKKKSGYQPRFLLFPRSLSSFGAIRNFLPFVRHDVIGYTTGSSITTQSGILDSLVRDCLSNPSDSLLEEKLEREICSIYYPSLVNRGNFLLPEEAQGAAKEEIAVDHRGLEKSATENSLSEVAEIIDLLLSAGESGRLENDVLLPLIRFAGKMLRLEKSQLESIVQDLPDSPLTQHRQVGVLEGAISKKGSSIESINLTRESVFPRSKLFKSLAQFVIGAKFGRIKVPEFLQKWVGSLARFVWIVPLDQITAFSGKPMAGPTVLVGSRFSSRYYPNLFSESPEEGAVEVRLDLLLNLLIRPLDCDPKNRWRGWLANRISETNELLVGLTVFAGYIPDFKLHSLLTDFQSSKCNLDVLLERLDSRLIVRCIMDLEGGMPFLQEWSDCIPKQVKILIPQTQGAADYINSDYRLDTLLEIFNDAAGIAVAALDCCRRRNGRINSADQRQKADQYTVYFLPGKLRDYYYSQNSLRETSSRKPNENVGGGNEGEDTFWNLEEGLGRLLMSSPFDEENALELIQLWQKSESNAHAETPYDLLMSVKDLLFPGRTPPNDFLRNCRSLLTVLQPEILRR